MDIIQQDEMSQYPKDDQIYFITTGICEQENTNKNTAVTKLSTGAVDKTALHFIFDSIIK